MRCVLGALKLAQHSTLTWPRNPRDSCNIISAATLCTASSAAVACHFVGMFPARQSLICNEYLEECHPHAAMLPRDPVARAHARIVIDRFNSKYVPVFYRFLIRCRPGAVREPSSFDDSEGHADLAPGSRAATAARRQEAAAQAECADQLQSELAWLDSQVDEGGPFFSGRVRSRARPPAHMHVPFHQQQLCIIHSFHLNTLAKFPTYVALQCCNLRIYNVKLSSV